MGYIGNQTSNSYTSLAKQTITGDGGASYTLDHAVANVNEIEVFVNNVRQEPSVAYTVSGTALTMTGNVESSDDFYVVFQGKAIQTVVPPDDSVTTARINDDAVTTAKIADDAITSALIADDAVKAAHINDDFYKTGTWTPTWSNLTLGNATVKAQYHKIGDFVTIQVHLDVGSTTTFNTSQVSLNGSSLPYTPDSNAYARANGTAGGLDSGVAYKEVRCWMSTSNGNIYFYTALDHTSYRNMNSTNPMTWTTNDAFWFTLTYKV